MNERKRFFITDRCIACGTCLAVCPQGCIVGGRPPFVIRDAYCVGCGRCVEKCPVRAIFPKDDGSENEK